jgi:hypothetical protein
MRKILLMTILGVLVTAAALPLVPALPLATAMPTPDENAFYYLWERTDAPVMANRVDRTWYWGPAPLNTLDEPYIEGFEGKRRVQYWDKGRMEISNPNENAQSPWYVTAGLLSLELISGRLQLGDQHFEERGAAQVPIAGDPNPDNPNAPTYASFATVTTGYLNGRPQSLSSEIIGGGLANPSIPPRYGDLVDESLDVHGNVGNRSDLATAYPGTRIVYYDEIYGHNIPSVFWDFLHKSDKVQINGEERQDLLVDWLYVMGHPVSEPYWVRTRVNHIEQDVMVQVYERRVLTYNPTNPPGWEVEMGNIGQHYYKWRYGMVEPVNPAAGGSAAPQQQAQAHQPVVIGETKPLVALKQNQQPGVTAILPTDFSALVEPPAAPVGTSFAVSLSGFQPGEEISIWITLPDQSVIPAPEMGVADHRGSVLLFGASPFMVATEEGDQTGVWAVSARGQTHNQTAIVYFTVTAP